MGRSRPASAAAVGTAAAYTRRGARNALQAQSAAPMNHQASGRLPLNVDAPRPGQLLVRIVGKLLPSDRCLIHEAALGDREHCNTVHVPAGSGGVRVRSAGAGARALRTGACRCTRGNGNGAGLCAERELPGLETGEIRPRLEKYDLAVGLAAGLKSYADLCHRGVTDVLAMLVYPPLAPRPADNESALADRREYGIAVA